MTAYNKWIDSANLKSVKVGERIDVCDTENIWCTAQVEIVIKTANRKDLLYVHYEGWNRKYDEYMYIDSHRLAPLGVYTGRQDIPIYRMVGNRGGDGQLNMMYAVVLNNAAEEQRLQEQERRINALHQQQQNDEEDEEEDEDGDEGAPDESILPEEPESAAALIEPPSAINRTSLQAQLDQSIENVNIQL